MIWATVSFWSCFCWLYRASPSLAAKKIINLISVLTIWWCPCVDLLLCCWKRVVAMTSAFSWQNSISICPATFHSKHLLPTTQEKTLHMDIIRWSTPKSDWLSSLQPKMENLYIVSKKQDQELTVAQIMNSLLPNSDLNWRKQGKPLDP